MRQPLPPEGTLPLCLQSLFWAGNATRHFLSYAYRFLICYVSAYNLRSTKQHECFSWWVYSRKTQTYVEILERTGLRCSKVLRHFRIQAQLSSQWRALKTGIGSWCWKVSRHSRSHIWSHSPWTELSWPTDTLKNRPFVCFFTCIWIASSDVWKVLSKVGLQSTDHRIDR